MEKFIIETGNIVESYNGIKGKIVDFNHMFTFDMVKLDTGDMCDIMEIKTINGKEVDLSGIEVIFNECYTDVEQIGTDYVTKMKHLPLGSSVRILNFSGLYSTYQAAFEYFGIMDKVRTKILQVSGSAETVYYLDKIPKKYQITEYIIKGYVLREYSFMDKNINPVKKLLYYIQSIDGQSDLIIEENSIEQIEEYHDINSY